MTDKILTYIAGPYSIDPAVCVHRAVLVADRLRQETYQIVPFVPHLFHLWHMIQPHGREYWMDIDLEMVARSDALIRVAGHSPGADREARLARELDKPWLMANPDREEDDYWSSLAEALIYLVDKKREGTG